MAIVASAEKIKTDLDQKFKKVREAPEGFTFFVSLHHFVEYIESTPSFAIFFSTAKKGSRAAEISPKYAVLRQIHQGIKDIDVTTTDDLGHDRFVAIRDLTLIRKSEVSENNTFWKRRESLRKLAGEIHKTLEAYLSE
jgi:hypothetical protein